MSSAKTARWLDLLAFLLQHRFAVTRSEIFERVRGYGGRPESARRTFERDKDELRSLGIDIETVELRDREGDEAALGYRLRDRGFYLPYLELSEEPDARAGEPPRRPVRPSAHPYAGLARLSLTPTDVRILDRATRRLAERTELPLAALAASARRKLAFDLSLDDGLAERVIGVPLPGRGAETLALLQRAVAERSPVACRYYSMGRDADEEREIEPYGLLFEASHWYCVGRARDRDALRVFRVDRMREARVPEGRGPFDVPASFDIRRYAGRAPWEVGDGPAETARIRFAFPESRWVLNQGRGRVLESLLDDGGSILAFEVRDRDAFLRWLLTFRRQAAVLEPADLAADLAALRRRVAERHA
jgi:predicted DNA-binding transcriptional regulator YafY